MDVKHLSVTVEKQRCGKLKTLVKYLIGKINYDSNKCRSLLATTKVLQLIIVSKLLAYSKM